MALMIITARQTLCSCVQGTCIEIAQKKVVRLWSDWSGLGCYSLHVGHDETGRGRSVGVFKTDMLAD